MTLKESSLINRISHVLAVLFFVGLGGWLFFFITSNQLPWDIFLANFIYFLGATQGVLIIAVILRICSAKWSGVLYRLATAVSLSFFPFALAMAISIIFFKDSIFYWAQTPHHPWNSQIFFILRFLLPMLLFYGVVFAIYKSSNADSTLSAEDMNSRHLFLGFLLLVTFFINQTIISWDMGMTLDPHYADTIYSLLFMAGSLMSGTAGLVILMSFLKKVSNEKMFKDDHFINIGQLLLALTMVTSYFRWSQFLTIWFSNLAEDTHAFYLKTSLNFRPVFIAMVILTVVIPFFGLIFKKVRNSEKNLSFISVSILIGFWLERYLLTAPALAHDNKAHLSLLNPVNMIFSVGIFCGIAYLLLNYLYKNPQLLPDDDGSIDANDTLIVNANGWR